ncbi:MAG: hypothetical protein WDW38_005667 [Sanguina aurantia]
MQHYARTVPGRDAAAELLAPLLSSARRAAAARTDADPQPGAPELPSLPTSPLPCLHSPRAYLSNLLSPRANLSGLPNTLTLPLFEPSPQRRFAGNGGSSTSAFDRSSFSPNNFDSYMRSHADLLSFDLSTPGAQAAALAAAGELFTPTPRKKPRGAPPSHNPSMLSPTLTRASPRLTRSPPDVDGSSPTIHRASPTHRSSSGRAGTGPPHAQPLVGPASRPQPTALSYKAGCALLSSPTRSVGATKLQSTEAHFSSVVTPGMARASVHRPHGWAGPGSASGLHRTQPGACALATPYSTSRSAAAHGQDPSRSALLGRYNGSAGRVQVMGARTPGRGGRGSEDAGVDLVRAVLGSPDPAATKDLVYRMQAQASPRDARGKRQLDFNSFGPSDFSPGRPHSLHYAPTSAVNATALALSALASPARQVLPWGLEQGTSVSHTGGFPTEAIAYASQVQTCGMVDLSAICASSQQQQHPSPLLQQQQQQQRHLQQQVPLSPPLAPPPQQPPLPLQEQHPQGQQEHGQQQAGEDAPEAAREPFALQQTNHQTRHQQAWPSAAKDIRNIIAGSREVLPPGLTVPVHNSKGRGLANQLSAGLDSSPLTSDTQRQPRAVSTWQVGGGQQSQQLMAAGALVGREQAEHTLGGVSKRRQLFPATAEAEAANSTPGQHRLLAAAAPGADPPQRRTKPELRRVAAAEAGAAAAAAAGTVAHLNDQQHPQQELFNSRHEQQQQQQSVSTSAFQQQQQHQQSTSHNTDSLQLPQGTVWQGAEERPDRAAAELQAQQRGAVGFGSRRKFASTRLQGGCPTDSDSGPHVSCVDVPIRLPDGIESKADYASQCGRTPSAAVRATGGPIDCGGNREHDSPDRVLPSLTSCRCKKSACLKLYCDCFAAGVFCTDCLCTSCMNREGNGEDVKTRRVQISSRDPLAFSRKILQRADGTSRSHKKGCNCKKSHCLKKYCECFQGGIGCGDACKCVECENMKPVPAPRGREASRAALFRSNSGAGAAAAAGTAAAAAAAAGTASAGMTTPAKPEWMQQPAHHSQHPALASSGSKLRTPSASAAHGPQSQTSCIAQPDCDDCPPSLPRPSVDSPPQARPDLHRQSSHTFSSAAIAHVNTHNADAAPAHHQPSFPAETAFDLTNNACDLDAHRPTDATAACHQVLDLVSSNSTSQGDQGPTICGKGLMTGGGGLQQAPQGPASVASGSGQLVPSQVAAMLRQQQLELQQQQQQQVQQLLLQQQPQQGQQAGQTPNRAAPAQQSPFQQEIAYQQGYLQRWQQQQQQQPEGIPDTSGQQQCDTDRRHSLQQQCNATHSHHLIPNKPLHHQHHHHQQQQQQPTPTDTHTSPEMLSPPGGEPHRPSLCGTKRPCPDPAEPSAAGGGGRPHSAMMAAAQEYLSHRIGRAGTAPAPAPPTSGSSDPAGDPNPAAYLSNSKQEDALSHQQGLGLQAGSVSLGTKPAPHGMQRVAAHGQGASAAEASPGWSVQVERPLPQQPDRDAQQQIWPEAGSHQRLSHPLSDPLGPFRGDPHPWVSRVTHGPAPPGSGAGSTSPAQQRVLNTSQPIAAAATAAGGTYHSPHSDSQPQPKGHDRMVGSGLAVAVRGAGGCNSNAAAEVLHHSTSLPSSVARSGSHTSRLGPGSIKILPSPQRGVVYGPR